MLTEELPRTSPVTVGADKGYEAGMPLANPVDFADGGELLDGVLPNGLEQLIPAAVAELQQKRLLDEPGRGIGDARGCLAVDRTHFFDRTEIEPTGDSASRQVPAYEGSEIQEADLNVRDFVEQLIDDTQPLKSYIESEQQDEALSLERAAECSAL